MGKIEGAAPYYGIPLEELHLEWSHEEELEIERYCEKILKNIAKGEMTLRQRFEATMARLETVFCLRPYILTCMRCEPWIPGADALKPRNYTFNCTDVKIRKPQVLEFVASQRLLTVHDLITYFDIK